MAYFEKKSLAIELGIENRLWRARFRNQGVLLRCALLEVEQDGSSQRTGFVGTTGVMAGRPFI